MIKVAKIGKRFQVVLPKEIRRVIKLSINDELIITLKNGQIVMTPKIEKYSLFIRGLGKELWNGKSAKDYVKKERESW